MTNIEFLKILCISCGYHNNLSIETWKDDCGDTRYEVSAENDDDFEIHCDCGDFVETIHYLIEEIHDNSFVDENGVINDEIYCKYQISSIPPYLGLLSQKELLNDETRQRLKINEENRIKQIEKECQLEREALKDFRPHPCKDCKLKTPVISLYDGRIIEDSINYDCNKHFLNNCDIVKEWYNDKDKILKEARNTNAL